MTAPLPGSLAREQSIEHLAAEPVIWLRLAATKSANEWQQTMLDMVGGAEPRSWHPLSLRYETALFEAAAVPGSEVARWFVTNVITIAGLEVALDEGYSPLTWERHRSLSTYGTYLPLRWPSTRVQFSSNAKGQEQGGGELVSPDDDVPSFETYYAAAAYLFGTAELAGGRGTAPPTYRHQDTSARINRVVVSEVAEALLVEVEGTDLDGCVLELAGSTPGPTLRLGPSETPVAVELVTPGGLPRDPWLLIRRGGQRLDRRSLGQAARANEPGVEFVAGVTTPLAALVASHENPTVEFKSSLPPSESSKSAVDKEVLRMVKTVAAFANQEGGVVLFGVTDDERVVGIERAGLDTDKQRLTSLVRSWVEPLPGIWYEEFDVEGHPELAVLGLRVQRGEEVPFGAGPRDDRKIYVRPYSETLPASISEIRAIVQSRVPRQHEYGPFGRLGL